MFLFRSIFLAGLILFFAAQQALCACDLPQAGATDGMAMAHEMPAGHNCDEGQMRGDAAPGHDKSVCPHCDNDAQLLLQAAQTLPAPVILTAPAPVPIHLASLSAPSPVLAVVPHPARYRAHAPPRQTPFQLKTRFLN